MSQLHSQSCWRCGYSPGDFSHVFWTCPAITVLNCSGKEYGDMPIKIGRKYYLYSCKKNTNEFTIVLCEEGNYIKLE